MTALREIVRIDEEKCNGCGQCVPACEEGAIRIVDGKARLVSETYCDGLGACLGECPEDAITIERRVAKEFDEEAARIYVQRLKEKQESVPPVCPGSAAVEIKHPDSAADGSPSIGSPSELTNWPVQLKLAPPGAQYFQDSDLLLVADCVPFAMADFHARLLRDKPVVIGCPKLDDADFCVDKLAEILKQASVNSLTIAHMEVPCCSGLSRIASRAVELSGADIPVSEITITIGGDTMGDSLSN